MLNSHYGKCAKFNMDPVNSSVPIAKQSFLKLLLEVGELYILNVTLRTRADDSILPFADHSFVFVFLLWQAIIPNAKNKTKQKQTFVVASQCFY